MTSYTFTPCRGYLCLLPLAYAWPTVYSTQKKLPVFLQMECQSDGLVITPRQPLLSQGNSPHIWCLMPIHPGDLPETVSGSISSLMAPKSSPIHCPAKWVSVVNGSRSPHGEFTNKCELLAAGRDRGAQCIQQGEGEGR